MAVLVQSVTPMDADDPLKEQDIKSHDPKTLRPAC